MALHTSCVDRTTHYFFGLQTKLLQGDMNHMQTQLDDFMKSAETGDVVVYDIIYTTQGGNQCVLILYSKFKLIEKKPHKNKKPVSGERRGDWNTI